MAIVPWNRHNVAIVVVIRSHYHHMALTHYPHAVRGPWQSALGLRERAWPKAAHDEARSAYTARPRVG